MKVSTNLQEMVLKLGVKESSYSNIYNVLIVVVKMMAIFKNLILHGIGLVNFLT